MKTQFALFAVLVLTGIWHCLLHGQCVFVIFHSQFVNEMSDVLMLHCHHWHVMAGS